MEVIKEAVREFYHGHQVVTTTKVRLTDLDFVVNKGVLLRAPGTNDPVPNTDPVWVGSHGVTSDSNEGTGGMPVMPGDAIFIPVDKPMLLWVVTNNSDQDIAWMGI